MTGCVSPERIFLYLEGEYGPDDRRAFEEHLGRCPACRAAYEERRLLHHAFTTLPAIELPPGFAGTVMAAIPRGKKSAASAFAALAAGLMALAASLTGFFLSTGQSLSDVFVSASQTLEAGISQLIPLLAKTLKSAGLALDLLYDVVSALSHALGLLSAAGRPGIAGLALGVGLILTVLLLYGAKRLLLLGERR